MLMFILFGFTRERKNKSSDFNCTITTPKEVYKLGETPEIMVSIINNSKKDVYLIGCLDASEIRWRSPFCYYTIDQPKKTKTPTVGRCGNMNSLKTRDFKLVKPGKPFNPYQLDDNHRFFGSREINTIENFQTPGKYYITFHYSTESTDLENYLGDGRKNRKLKKWFKKVPHLKLESNTLEIEFKN